MSKLEERTKFLELLFDDGDHIAWGNDRECSNKPMDPYPIWFSTNAEMFCINPLKDWRKTQNVTSINSMLFEMDEDENDEVIPTKQQIRMWLESGIPFTTMTYSGNKSVHVIVRFDEPIEDKMWQRQWWKAIYEVLVHTFKMPIDKNTKALPQLSRMPCSVRQDTGKQQKLILTRARVTQREMKEWIEANGGQLRKPSPPTISDYEPGTNDDVLDAEKFKTAVRWTTKSQRSKYESLGESGSHMWLFQLGLNCYKTDMRPESSVRLATGLYGTEYVGTNGGGYVERAVLDGWQWAEVQSTDKVAIYTRVGQANRIKANEDKILNKYYK
jgi:hypothetical protein